MSIDNLLDREKTQQIQKILSELTEINFIKAYQGDEGLIAFTEKQKGYCTREIQLIKNRISGGFVPNVVSSFMVEGATTTGEKIDIEVKLYTKTMMNLLDKDIIENIEKKGSMDLIDVDFEFIVRSYEYKDLDYSNNYFFKKAKKTILDFIKSNPKIEREIVSQYCDILKESLLYIKKNKPIAGRIKEIQKEIRKIIQENTGERELSLVHNDIYQTLLEERKLLYEEIGGSAIGTGEIDLYINDIENCGKKIYESILQPIEQSQKTIKIDSKYFYFDNGNNLYNEIIDEGPYKKYYNKQIDILETYGDKIAPNVYGYYISLGCGNGRPDEILLDARRTYYIKNKEGYEGDGFQPYADNVLLIESSLKALKSAENRINKKFPHIQINTSLSRVNEFVEKGKIPTMFCHGNMILCTSNMDQEVFKDIKKTIVLLGGTFGNFEGYKKLFLQQLDHIMGSGDTLIISVFNIPKTQEEKGKALSMYHTEQEEKFFKNFFQKLGIGEENIDVKIVYDKTDTIRIDALIVEKGNKPILARVNNKVVRIPHGTKFECIVSERFSRDKFKNEIENSDSELYIKDVYEKKDNPFSLYVLEKK